MTILYISISIRFIFAGFKLPRVKRNISSIILSRTDSIGDMVLALPMAKVLKDNFPGTKIYFLGREYTRPVVNACIYVDGFIELNDFLNTSVSIDNKTPQAIVHVKPLPDAAKRAKQMRIKWRIGTTNRVYHWNTCNKLVKLSRKRSDLHEAQLNLKLLQPLGIKKEFPLECIREWYGLEKLQPLQHEVSSLIDGSKYNLILHPKSRGSAREWGLKNFISLIHLLDKHRYKLFISGTEAEKELVRPLVEEVPHLVTDISGKLNLEQFMSFISQCDGLVACSTGPLHLAAALGIDALGIYAPLHSIRPERWGPVGKKTEVFVLNKKCSDCYKNKMPCHCVGEIDPLLIKKSLDNRNHHIRK
jgi:ADP-heptose:LPS heptosyltransferase